MNYVLYGEEQYLLSQSLDRIVKTHVSDKNDLNCIVYDANTTDLEVILEDAMTIPFFLIVRLLKFIMRIFFLLLMINQ